MLTVLRLHLAGSRKQSKVTISNKHMLVTCTLLILFFSPCSYESKLKKARTLGAKKGFIIGVSVAFVFFIFFIFSSVAFW